MKLILKINQFGQVLLIDSFLLVRQVVIIIIRHYK